VLAHDGGGRVFIAGAACSRRRCFAQRHENLSEGEIIELEEGQRNTMLRWGAGDCLFIYRFPCPVFALHVRVIPFLQRFGALRRAVSAGDTQQCSKRGVIATLLRSIMPPILVLHWSLNTVESHTGHLPSHFPAKPMNGLLTHCSHMMQPQFSMPRLFPLAASPLVLQRGLGHTNGS
jgi:hypothetical protein